MDLNKRVYLSLSLIKDFCHEMFYHGTMMTTFEGSNKDFLEDQFLTLQTSRRYFASGDEFSYSTSICDPDLSANCGVLNINEVEFEVCNLLNQSFNHIKKFEIKLDSDLKDFHAIQKNMQNFSLDSVEYVVDSRPFSNAYEIFRLFKNIKHLKCVSLTGIRRYGENMQDLTSHTLKSLEMDYVHCSTMCDVNFPNIDVITAKKMKFLDNMWGTFLVNAGNANLIVVESITRSQDIIEIISDLIERRRPFKIRHCSFNAGKFNIDDDEKVERNKPFYKILVHENENVIKVSSYIFRNIEWIIMRLNECFEGYEIAEFCIERPQYDDDSGIQQNTIQNSVVQLQSSETGNYFVINVYGLNHITMTLMKFKYNVEMQNVNGNANIKFPLVFNEIDHIKGKIIIKLFGSQSYEVDISEIFRHFKSFEAENAIKGVRNQIMSSSNELKVYPKCPTVLCCIYASILENYNLDQKRKQCDSNPKKYIKRLSNKLIRNESIKEDEIFEKG